MQLTDAYCQKFEKVKHNKNVGKKSTHHSANILVYLF